MRTQMPKSSESDIDKMIRKELPHILPAKTVEESRKLMAEHIYKELDLDKDGSTGGSARLCSALRAHSACRPVRSSRGCVSHSISLALLFRVLQCDHAYGVLLPVADCESKSAGHEQSQARSAGVRHSVRRHRRRQHWQRMAVLSSLLHLAPPPPSLSRRFSFQVCSSSAACAAPSTPSSLLFRLQPSTRLAPLTVPHRSSQPSASHAHARRSAAPPLFLVHLPTRM